MTDIGLFIFGVFITLIMVGAIILLLWAAVEDGRKQAEVASRLEE